MSTDKLATALSGHTLTCAEAIELAEHVFGQPVATNPKPRIHAPAGKREVVVVRKRAFGRPLVTRIFVGK